jgi:DNA (cytosine-5)-methyltransferase 1
MQNVEIKNVKPLLQQTQCCKQPLRVLNLYAGIGGNRQLWQDVQVTAVELNEKVANEYKRRFPNDNVIVGDAHNYLLHNFKNYDFIWGSPPCPKHSRTNYFTQYISKEPSYPDMKLWQEIIYLKQFCKNLWVIENVIPYYEPFLPNYTKIGRHLIWSNFKITPIQMPKNEIGSMDNGWNTACKIPLEERNAVNADLGLHILNCARGNFEMSSVKQTGLFSELQ